MKHDTKIRIEEQGEEMFWWLFLERNRPFISDEHYSKMLNDLTEFGKHIYRAGSVTLTLSVVK